MTGENLWCIRQKCESTVDDIERTIICNPNLVHRFIYYINIWICCPLCKNLQYIQCKYLSISFTFWIWWNNLPITVKPGSGIIFGQLFWNLNLVKCSLVASVLRSAVSYVPVNNCSFLQCSIDRGIQNTCYIAAQQLNTFSPTHNHMSVQRIPVPIITHTMKTVGKYSLQGLMAITK